MFDLQRRLATYTAILALVLTVPGGHGAGDADHCTASTALGDGSSADCAIRVDRCSGACTTYRIDITVTADPSLDGAATPYVEGDIAGTNQCSGFGSCTGSFTFTQSTVVAVNFRCEGTGIEGQDLPHTLTALTVTCERSVI